MAKHLAPTTPETHQKNVQAIKTANYAFPRLTGRHVAMPTIASIEAEVAAEVATELFSL